MKDMIQKIIESEDGRVFTVSKHSIDPSAELFQGLVNKLIEHGIDPKEAKHMRLVSSTRIMRAPHMETEVPVADATKEIIDRIKDGK